MKNSIKLLSALFLSVLMTTTFTSCSDNDDEVTTIYSYTLETYTDLIISPNTEGATQATELFIDKNWMMTKAISGSTLEKRDLKAKNLFQSIVEQANAAFMGMDFHGNTKLTYKCTRSNTTNNSEVQIDIQEWNYLD